jgi:probable phosphoglycerate mutase
VRRLLLWRHGRTAWNACERVQGQSDVLLDDVGLRQAFQTAPLLAAYDPELVASSDLTRAIATAEPLADLVGVPVATDARLRERNFGPWQGQTLTEIEAGWPADFHRWQRGEPIEVAGVETTAAVAARVGAALADLAADAEVTVVVSHGSALRLGMATLLGWPEQVAYTVYGLENCHWVELRHNGRGWRLAGYNHGLARSGDAASVGVEERPAPEDEPVSGHPVI